MSLRIDIRKIPLSISRKEKLVHLSTKVTAETKSRFQAQVKNGRTHEELIKMVCEVCEYADAELEASLKQGKIKKEFKTLMHKVK